MNVCGYVRAELEDGEAFFRLPTRCSCGHVLGPRGQEAAVGPSSLFVLGRPVLACRSRCLPSLASGLMS